MQQSVLGHLVPLLLAYDTTHEEGSQGGQPAFDLEGDSAERGPAFLGLGIERTNMQVALPTMVLERTSSKYMPSNISKLLCRGVRCIMIRRVKRTPKEL